MDREAEIVAFGAMGGMPVILLRNWAKECIQKNREFGVLGDEFKDLAVDCFRI